MRPTRWISVISIASAMATASCGGEPQPAPEYPPVDDDTGSDVDVVAEPEEPEETEPEEPEEPPPPPVQVVSAERTAIEGDAPTIKLLTPRDGQRLGNTIRMRVRLKNWELAPAPGKHIHVIVDNEPYIAVREISVQKPVDLMKIVEDAHGGPLEEGTHVLRTFPSRANHESVKEGTPFEMIVFHYKRESDFEFDPEAPLLTYSRPKGCYPEGERILLDFYLTNVEELSEDGYRVQYTVDDETSGEITEWAPHYIENLAKGDHTIRLQLIGEDGEPVDGPFNDTTRTISVGDCGGDDGAEEESDGEEPDEDEEPDDDQDDGEESDEDEES